jgi:hypothetical protein
MEKGGKKESTLVFRQRTGDTQKRKHLQKPAKPCCKRNMEAKIFPREALC